MSRCFPFPPPGYEKKLNISDANLLAKAKNKEKKDIKHKKDKKNKEEKEGKEKDKDRSKEKWKDKKEKKEKHRDKNLEKNNLSDEKRIEGPGGSILQSNHFAEASYVQELAKRIKDDDSATGSKTLERNAPTNQKQVGSSGTVAANVSYHSERKEMSKDKNASKKIAHEQRENYEIGVRKVAIVHNFSGKGKKKVDMVKPMEKDDKKAVETKEKERPHGISSNGDTIKVKDEKRFNRQVELSNGKMFGSDKLQNSQFKQNGLAQEFGEVRHEHAAPKSQFAEKNIRTDQKRSGSVGEASIGANPKREGPVGRIVENNISYCSEGKGISNERNGFHPNERNGFHSKANGQSDKARGPKVSFVHNLSRMAEQRRVEGFDSLEKGIKRTAERKDKSKREELDCTADRCLDRKQTPKFGERIVERTGVQIRESGEPNKKVLKIKEVVREIEDGSKSCLTKDSNKISASEGSAKKRKQPELNGFLIDNEIWPSKLQRPPTSCHPPIENGRKLDEARSIFPHYVHKEKGTAVNHKLQEQEPKRNGTADPLQPTVRLAKSPSQGYRSSASSIISQFAFKEKGTVINYKLEEETKINGFLDQSQSTINSSVSSSAAPKAEKSHKAPSVKPPHPDTKYLSQILSVPKVEDSAELDTQDWLFNSDLFSSKKPESGASGAKTQQQVWDKALHIQSADISALPYVIPY